MDLLGAFNNAQNNPDPTMVGDVRQYIEWLSRSGNPVQLTNENLRAYLEALQAKGTDHTTLLRVLCSLELFYGWLKSTDQIANNPFENFNFKQLFIPPAQIHQRRDTFLGTTEEREIARLRALNKLADLTNQIPDAGSIINKTLETLLGVLSLDTAWVSTLADSSSFTLPSPSSPKHDFILTAARDLPESLKKNDYDYLTRPPDCRCQRMLRSGQLKHAVNIVECDRLRDAAHAGENNNGLMFHASVPVFSGDRAIGVMNFAMEDWQLLSEADLEVLQTGGEMLRSALYRAHLYDRSQKQLARLEEELEVARKMQASLLPRKTPVVPGYNLAAFWKPANQISGDFYGIYRLPGQRWGLVIADVCGKGASAALFMAMTYSLIRERVEKEPSPAALLARVNHHLHRQLADSNFVTCAYIVLDTAANTLTYANAGHNLPLLRAANGEITPLPRGGIALGVLPEAVYQESTILLAPGDSLVMYTDGVTDALNAHGDLFELSRLEENLALTNASAPDLVEHLKNGLFSWAGDTPQHDDITLLALTRETQTFAAGQEPTSP